MSDDKERLDLEAEFSRLMEGVLDKIKSNTEAGLYDEFEASDLKIKLKNFLDHGDTSNHGNQCPYGHSDTEGCGWSPSMGYHCT